MEAETATFFSYFKDIVSLFTPLLLAYFSYLTVKKEKHEKENKILRDKYEKEMENKRNAIDKKRDDAINAIRDDVSTLQDQIQKLEGAVDMKEINKSLNKLVDISSFNIEYSQSLSHVVVTIGETLKKSNPNSVDIIEKAIEAHHKTERDMLQNEMFKVFY